MQARALWISKARQAEIRAEALPELESDQLSIRTLYSALSRGTESLVFHGAVPASEHQRMRAPFQAGDFPWPVKYGYCNVGRVEQGPASWLGQNVFCLYPHQDHYVVPVTAVTRIPAEVPAERAVLAANLETAINALWDSEASIGDRISVVGAGVLGCLVAWLAAGIRGCDVELIDINPSRQAIAKRLGAGFALPENAQGDRDRVIHASASEQGLQTSLRLAGREATVVELSWYGDRGVNVPLGEAFHSQRLQIRSSQVGRIPSHQQARWDFGRRMQLAISLLQRAEPDVLISGESDFRDLPDTLPTLLAEGADVLCHRIRYP